MQILLDTHIYLWWLNDDKQLSQKAREFIYEAETAYVSSVSIWEAAIKSGLGKLTVNIEELVDAIDNNGFTELPFTAIHAAKITALPLHHRDPFDRALIAQAMTEPLRLLTADKVLGQYSELVECL